MKAILRSGALVCAFLFASNISILAQGSLTPPGAPAPTMKTLDQVEPRTRIPGGTTVFTISSEGSYYLSGNLSITSGSAITVAANNVTIDLQGFEVAGTGGFTGIVINSGISNVTIRNGTIRNFTSVGINGAGNSTVRVEKVRALNNGSVGIKVDINGAVIDCVAEANAGVGIVGADNCVIHHCQSIGNTGTSSHGISVGNDAQISGCVARTNGGSGIVAGTSGELSDCVANNNSGIGINLGGGCTLSNCIASNNAGSAGISVTAGCTIINCIGNTNGDFGITVGDRNMVSGCTCNSNQVAGIVAANDCVIINNHASQNGGGGGGGSGIEVTGSNNRVEGNSVHANNDPAGSYGIYPVSPNVGNVIIKNTARGNNTENYHNAAGNADYGPFGSPSSATNPFTNFQ